MSRKSLCVIILGIFFIFTSATIFNIYGHGLGSEIFPPINLEGKQVSLEISSTPKNPKTNENQQISISLIDFNSKVTIRDVTFLIKSSRGDQFLFEKEFQSTNGNLIFNFISDDVVTIQLQEENSSDFLGSLIGLKNHLVNIRGPHLSDGGLYKFDIKIITAGSFSKKLDLPPTFNAGISIAQITSQEITHSIFGSQIIKVVTYYDEIKNFQYDEKSKVITFSMPFEWSINNINQTSVVHEELIIPKTFGDLLVSGFSIYVNGIKLSDSVVSIDDFFYDERIVHFIINQQELWNIFNYNLNQKDMNFLIRPNLDTVELSSVTENGQFRIVTSWKPNTLQSDSKATISFDITDTFLKNKPVAVNYDFSITQNDKVIFKQTGISTDSKENHNIIEFFVPEDISGIVYLKFENLGHNNLAKTSIPIIIYSKGSENTGILIPEWLRNNAGWWSRGQIDDDSFILAVQYLIQEKIITIPPTTQNSIKVISEIPNWIKNNAGWWAQGKISDDDFVLGIQFLIKEGIMEIKP